MKKGDGYYGKLIGEWQFQEKGYRFYRFLGICVIPLHLIFCFFVMMALVVDGEYPHRISLSHLLWFFSLGGLGYFIKPPMGAAKKKYFELAVFENGFAYTLRGRSDHRHFRELAGIREIVYPSARGVVDDPIEGLGIENELYTGFLRSGIELMLWMDENDGVYLYTNIFNLDGTVSSGEFDTSVGINTLTDAYTKWMIEAHGINKETLPQLSLSFGKYLSLEQGVLIQHGDNDSRKIPLAQVMNITVDEFGQLAVWTQKGGRRAKRTIDVPLVHVLNVELLFKVVEMGRGGL
ncbi:MAG: hypothetical protein FWF59_07695 [Turicibacter sp.]|nr:hypothetical protein [Turicibacter sp.]